MIAQVARSFRCVERLQKVGSSRKTEMPSPACTTSTPGQSMACRTSRYDTRGEIWGPKVAVVEKPGILPFESQSSSPAFVELVEGVLNREEERRTEWKSPCTPYHHRKQDSELHVNAIHIG